MRACVRVGVEGAAAVVEVKFLQDLISKSDREISQIECSACVHTAWQLLHGSYTQQVAYTPCVFSSTITGMQDLPGSLVMFRGPMYVANLPGDFPGFVKYRLSGSKIPLDCCSSSSAAARLFVTVRSFGVCNQLLLS